MSIPFTSNYAGGIRDTSKMTSRRIGTREEWAAASAELLEREKEHTRAGDELARQRRELPWVPVEKEYTFQTEHGPATLPELFDGRSQLVAYRQRMGWSFHWASSHDNDFNADFGVSAGDPTVSFLEAGELKFLKLLDEQPAIRENPPLIPVQNARASGTDLDGYLSEGHGLSTFAREGDTVYHSYSSYARGTEFMMAFYAILDRAPKGREEGDQPMTWLRRHDEYRNA